MLAENKMLQWCIHHERKPNVGDSAVGEMGGPHMLKSFPTY